MKKHYREENDCLNCGATLQGPFCHICGQENLQIKESFGHMMDHAISDYFHFDHKFFHTLKPLFFKPGLLTNEYMAGRRTQYLHPVKMYIFISVVYFLLLFHSSHQIVQVNNTNSKPANTQKVIDSINNKIAKNPNLSAAQKKRLQEDIEKNAAQAKSSVYFTTEDTTYSEYLASQKKLPENKRDGFFDRLLTQKVLTYREKYGPRAKEVFLDEFQHNIPKMMFVMLPILAFMISIAFWKNKKFYVEHLIYTFHLYCFLFLFLASLMLAEMIIPAGWRITPWINFAATVYVLWYIYRSLRVVYHRKRFRTITKMIGITIAYSVTSIACLLALLIITALTAV